MKHKIKTRIVFVLALGLMLSFYPNHIKAADAPIRILIVPGHDNDVWGAQYKDMKEADMNLDLAERIYKILKKDERFKVYITRDEKGYTKEFASYFVKQRASIRAFIEQAKKDTQDKIMSGSFIPQTAVVHNNVSTETAIKLYGINKWANEHDIDAVIHVHFNDIPRPDVSSPGKYTGFTIYIPDKQLLNGAESTPLGEHIFSELDKRYNTSTHPLEKGGLVPNQKLIALGSYNTLPKVRSVLIEYSYITEKRFQRKSTRDLAYKSMASLTARGIKDYFLKP